MSVRRGSALVLAAAIALAPIMATAQGSDPCQSDAVCRFLAQNIGIKEPATIRQLRALATLESDTKSAVRNLHVADQTDTTHILRYAGLEIHAYAPSDVAYVLVTEIVVTSAKYPLPLKLTFGKSTFEDVQQALGLAKDIKHLADGSAEWRYENVEGTASVVFAFEPEPSMKIKRVRWAFSTD